MKSLIVGVYISGLNVLVRALLSTGLFFTVASVSTSDDIGNFSLMLIVSMLMTIISDWGFNLRLYKKSCIAPESIDARRYLSAKLSLSIIAIIILSSITFQILSGALLVEFLLYGISGVFQSFANLGFLIKRSQGDYIFEFRWQIFSACISLLLIMYTALIDCSLIVVSVCVFSARLITAVGVFYTQGSNIFYPYRIHIQKQWRLIKINAKIGIFSLVSFGYLYIDTFLVSMLVSSDDFALYQIQIRIILTILMGYEAINIVVQNEFLKVINNKIKFKRLSSNIVYILVSSLVLFYYIGNHYYEEMIVTLLGEDKRSLATYYNYMFYILYLRALGTIVSVPITFYGGYFRLIYLGISIFVSLCCNLYLIPNYGIEGAMIVAVASHAVLNILYIFRSFGRLDKPKFIAFCVMPVFLTGL